MNNTDLAKVALKAKGLEAGPVAIEEVEFARDVLRRRGNGIIDAIHVVGLCGSPKDAPLLEAFLQGEENNVYVEYALKALCRYLGLVDSYRPLLRRWMIEGDGFRRMPSIYLAKEFFCDFEDNELGRYLIDVLCDIDDGCRSAVRGAFVDMFALREQLNDPFGLDWGDWDEDTNLILKAAAEKFAYRAPLIISGRAVH